MLLINAQNEIRILYKKIQRYKNSSINFNTNEFHHEMIKYFQRNILSQIDHNNISGLTLKRRIRMLMSEQPKPFVHDMQRHGLIDEDMLITVKGMELMEELLEKRE